MEIVRDLQALIEVKKEVMEEEQHEHARRHAQLQSVVEAKMKDAAELRGRLNAIALAFECTLCFEKLGAGSVSFGCGHTYCNRLTCGSCLVDTCPECRLPVASRVQLFGALPDVGGLLEQEPAAQVGQVQRLPSENAKASLEEIRKRSEEEKAAWQREKEEMQRLQVNRLQGEVLAAANAKASLEEIRKRSGEDKAVWQREREEMQQQVNRLREANASLEAIRVQQNDQINKLLNAETMSAKQATQELDAERIGKEDVLQQKLSSSCCLKLSSLSAELHVAQQTKKRVSGGSKEQNAEQSAAAPPNKEQKQNMPGKACDADCFLAQVKSLQSQSDAPLVKASRPHPRPRPSPHSLQYTYSPTSLFASRIAAAIGVVDGIMVRIRAVKEPEESHLLPGLLRELEAAAGCR